MNKTFAKGAAALAFVTLFAACSEPTATTDSSDFSKSSAPMSSVQNATFTSVTSPSAGVILAKWDATPDAKSYNVHIATISSQEDTVGGTHHIDDSDMVNGKGETSWTDVPPGSYQLCIKVQGLGTPFGDCVPFTLAGASVDQTITFGPIDEMTYGDDGFNASATSSNPDNPIIFTTELDEDDCTVTPQGAVTITGAGSCKIIASQPAAPGFNAATPVSQTFAIAKGSLSATVTSGASAVYGDEIGEISCDANGIAYDDEVTVTCTTTAVKGDNVDDDYPITAAFVYNADNYDVDTDAGDFAITQAKLVFSVSPSSATRTFGQPNPTCSYTVTGEKMDESVSASCSWSADATSPVTSLSNPATQNNIGTKTCLESDAVTECSMGNYKWDPIPTAALTIAAYSCANGNTFTQPVGLMGATKAPVKLGSVVPHKFTCTDPNNNNAPITNIKARYEIRTMAGSTIFGLDNAFKLANSLTGQYLYGFDSTKLVLGVQYAVFAILNDNTTVIAGQFYTVK